MVREVQVLHHRLITMKTAEELSNLTDDQLRKLCGEYSGWRRTTDKEFRLYAREWIREIRHEVAHANEFPDYPHDLNAMAKEEETLSEQERADYADELFHLTEPVFQTGTTEDGDPEIATDMFKWLTASARQRCIAFIVTKTNSRVPLRAVGAE